MGDLHCSIAGCVSYLQLLSDMVFSLVHDMIWMICMIQSTSPFVFLLGTVLCVMCSCCRRTCWVCHCLAQRKQTRLWLLSRLAKTWTWLCCCVAWALSERGHLRRCAVHACRNGPGNLINIINSHNSRGSAPYAHQHVTLWLQAIVLLPASVPANCTRVQVAATDQQQYDALVFSSLLRHTACLQPAATCQRVTSVGLQTQVQCLQAPEFASTASSAAG